MLHGSESLDFNDLPFKDYQLSSRKCLRKKICYVVLYFKDKMFSIQSFDGLGHG